MPGQSQVHIEQLLKKLNEIFFSVSKATQKISYKVEPLIAKYFDEMGIIYGYFVEFDPNKNYVEYFIDDDLSEKKQRATSFNSIYIPYFGKNESSQKKNEKNIPLFTKLKENSVDEFKTLFKSPKIYQHLPVQEKGRAKFELSSNAYLNTEINKYISSSGNYYVVLFEEIAFFQFAFEGQAIIERYGTRLPLFIRFLLRFALSVEAKMSEDRALARFMSLSDDDNWGTSGEVNTREEIDSIIEKKISEKNWLQKVLFKIEKIVEELLVEYRKKEIYQDRTNEELLKHIARFDIESSFLVTDNVDDIIFHDMFVFPLYTESKTIYTTDFIEDGYSIDLHSPILLVLYIKTLYLLSDENDIDETVDSVDGFELTKAISKIFAERLIQEDYLVQVTRKETHAQATKAAISQVMARNMSHNIGSHVMNKMLSVDDMEASVKSKNYKAKDVGTKKELRDHVLVFNSYLKARMDYLADVTFGTPVMQTNKDVYTEIFKGFDQNILLLNNISALGTNFIYEINFAYNGIRMDEKSGIKIAMPNDLLGCQAFYNILENIIRNTAKHAKDKPEVVVFTINISESDVAPSLYMVEVYDNVVVKNRTNEGEIKEHIRQYNSNPAVQNKISELDEIDWLVYKQNKTINTSILNEQTNLLRTTALGMIELATSAAYLRKIAIDEIESDEFIVEYDEADINRFNKLNVLKTFNKDGCLGYRFFVFKPTEVLLIGSFGNEILSKRNSLLEEGICILSKEQFESAGDVYNHQFLLYDDASLNDIIFYRRTSLPTRRVKTDAEQKKQIDLILANTAGNILSELECFIWEIWNANLFNRHKISDLKIYSSVHDDDKKDKVFHAAFINHNETWECNKANFKQYDDVLSDNSFAVGNASYCESLSSFAQSKLPGFQKSQVLVGKNDRVAHKPIIRYYPYINRRKEYEEKINYYKLSESILAKILVVDERIQEASINNRYNSDDCSVPFGDLYAMTNIVLPNSVTPEGEHIKEIDLSANNFDEALIGQIKGFILTHVVDCDFLLIHYSILERMFDSDKGKINAELKKISRKIKTVITSGRGKPPGLPGYVSFVNLTPVLDSFIENRSKYSINYLLNSARR
jgi:hypothetical protein